MFKDVLWIPAKCLIITRFATFLKSSLAEHQFFTLLKSRVQECIISPIVIVKMCSISC